MKKLFNNTILLRIMIVILLIFSSHLFIRNNSYKNFTYNVISEDLENAMSDVRNLNRVIKVFIKRKNNDIKLIELDSVEKIRRFHRETEELLGLKYYSFDWYDIHSINFNLRDILKKDEIKKEDIEYLVAVSSYIDKFEKIYEDSFENDENYYKDSVRGRSMFFKDYKRFTERSTNLFNSEEFYEIRYHR